MDFGDRPLSDIVAMIVLNAALLTSDKGSSPMFGLSHLARQLRHVSIVEDATGLRFRVCRSLLRCAQLPNTNSRVPLHKRSNHVVALKRRMVWTHLLWRIQFALWSAASFLPDYLESIARAASASPQQSSPTKRRTSKAKYVGQSTGKGLLGTSLHISWSNGNRGSKMARRDQ